MKLLNVKSVVLATLISATATCFVLAFSASTQANARDLSPMEMARLFGGENVENMCCEEDWLCYDTISYSVSCPYRTLGECDSFEMPNYYEALVGWVGRYCSKDANYPGVICIGDEGRHICLERRYCQPDYVNLECDEEVLMTFETPNGCIEDLDQCYF